MRRGIKEERWLTDLSQSRPTCALGVTGELAEDSGFSPEAVGHGHLSPEIQLIAQGSSQLEPVGNRVLSVDSGA